MIRSGPWSATMDVGGWLRGLGQYEALFRASDIDADILPELTEVDLEKLGVSLGHRKRLLRAISGFGRCVSTHSTATSRDIHVLIERGTMQAPRCRMRSELVEHCHPAHGGVARQGSDHAFKWPLRLRTILGFALFSLACLTTDGGLLSVARRGAFAQAAPTGPRLVDDNGTPVGGWWAMAPSPQDRIAVLARWMPTAAMNMPHFFHTATLLLSGQVLVVDGFGGDNFSPAATEVYNPVTGQWALTGALNTPRLNPSVTLLTSGQVLVAGGLAEGNPAAELYNPATAQWTLTGALHTARFGHTATLLHSGQVLVAGGEDRNTLGVATAELYDPKTGQWTLTGALNTPRLGHTATLLPSGQVLVAGGDTFANGLPATASTEVYDPATGRWTLTAAMNTARDSHTATLLPSGQVLVAGGDLGAPSASTEVYDPATGRWTLTAAMNTARFSHTATLLPSGQVLVAGGGATIPPGGDRSSVLASTEVYDPGTGQWTLAAPLNTPRQGHTATLLPSGQVLVAGGGDGNGNWLTSAELRAAFRSVVADGASMRIDDTALFNFTDLHRPLVRAAGGLPLDLAKVDQSGDWTAVVDDPARTATFFQNTAPLVVTDLGRYQVQLGVRRQDSSLANLFLKTSLSYPTVMAHYDQPPPDPAAVPLTVLFRFFPDGKQLGALQEGEIAIFQECNYQGKAAVFIADTPNLAALTSSDITLDKSAASVRLGNNTAITLYSGSGYIGTSQVVKADTPCLAATSIGNNTTSSFQIEPLVPNLLSLLKSSKACEHCQLAGVDLSGLGGLDLSGFDFQGAILDNATGWAGTAAPLSQLSGALFNNASLKNVDLSNALLYGANFTNANLENASLSGAYLTNNVNANPPIGVPANFTGAHLKNVNLSGAHLDGVLFDHASFYGSFYGYAPTFPCQTDTTQCTAAKTGFTCSCATVVGATMVRTNFSSAYLYGVDFGGSTTIINGVSFTGAVLVGANFTHAAFAVDPTQGGAPPDFSSAYLQGAQFDPNANLTDTSLSGAFVDFGAATNPHTGNIMQLLLGPAYTAFHGWEAPNQPVCVQAAYGRFTVVPTTIPTMTCPDGNTYTKGCGTTQAGNTPWASPTPIGRTSPGGWYQFDATYTPADQSNACNGTTYNSDW
jgi:uncharacterized protein YjbI with pentapeptide repeats